MSSLIEDRLRDALVARAEQVTPEDLRPLSLAAAPERGHRASAVLAGLAAAAAVAAVVSVPFLGDHGAPEPAEPTPTPTSTPSSSPDDVDQSLTELDADLDGDGERDRIWLDGDLLKVTGSSGTSIEAPFVDGGRLLLPVTDSGTTNPLIVALAPAGSDVLGLTVTFREDAIVVDEAPAAVADGPGRVVWVDDIGALMVGQYDPAVPEDQRVLVTTTGYGAKRNGRLVEYGAGDLCWDRRVDDTPVSCEQLEPEDADPSLMFPRVETGSAIGEVSSMFDGEFEKAELVRRPSGALELEVTWDGVLNRAVLPEGPTATLLDTTLRGGGGDMPAFVVAQDFGENVNYTVVSWFEGRFQAIPTADEGGWLGTGYYGNEGEGYQRTWLSQTNILWTARQFSPEEPERYELVRWSDEIGPSLVPVDQGEVCLDIEAGTKLPDATCGAP